MLQFTGVRIWWREHSQILKFWAIVIIGLLFIAIPWVVGICYLYMFPLAKWILY
jgi:hypothetical protein